MNLVDRLLRELAPPRAEEDAFRIATDIVSDILVNYMPNALKDRGIKAYGMSIGRLKAHDLISSLKEYIKSVQR